MHTLEIHFWRVVNPLMNKSAGVRWFMRSAYRTTKPLGRAADRILESPFAILYFAAVLVLGSAAFGFGYLIGLWLG
jgi:hypothetical protein